MVAVGVTWWYAYTDVTLVTYYEVENPFPDWDHERSGPY